MLIQVRPDRNTRYKAKVSDWIGKKAILNANSTDTLDCSYLC